ncbi:MAG: hypothetical protein WBC07_10210 [Methylotenera sp.]
MADNSNTIIAISALVLTVWQGYITRQHNKLSVVPYLTTWSHADGENGFYSIEIMNNGIGPALIKAFQVFVDGIEIKGNESELVDKATKKLFGDFEYQSANCFLSSGYMMAEKNKHEIFSIKFIGQRKLNYQEYKQTIERARLVIEYESIYKDKFIYDSDKFSLLN